MKKFLKALFVVLTVTLFTVAFAATASAATASAAEYNPRQILVYKGLQARAKNDNPGLRSLYEVDDELIAELVEAKHSVQYGALMGIGRIGTTDYCLLDDMQVEINEGIISVKAGAPAKPSMVIVYDSTGENAPTGAYTSRGEVKSTFAYTTKFGYSSENTKMLKDVEIVYRAFIIIDGEITYVDAMGTTFGKEDAVYGRATSLYEVCDYFANGYKVGQTKPYENSVAVRRVISACMDDSFKVEYADGISLTSDMASASTVTVNVPAIKAGIYAIKMNYIHPGANNGYRFTVKNTTTGEIARAKMPINTSNATSDVATPEWSKEFIYMYLAEGANTLKIAADSAISTLYGVELTQKLSTPVEDTDANHVTTSNTEFWYGGEKIGVPYSDKTVTFDRHNAGKTYFVRNDVTVKHTLTVNTAAIYDFYIVGSAPETKVTATVNGQPKTVAVPATYVIGAGTQTITSEGSGTNLIKLGAFSLEKGNNTVEITNTGWLAVGSIVAVRQAETVTLYDADGKTPISVQKVYDVSDVVFPRT